MRGGLLGTVDVSRDRSGEFYDTGNCGNHEHCGGLPRAATDGRLHDEETRPAAAPDDIVQYRSG